MGWAEDKRLGLQSNWGRDLVGTCRRGMLRLPVVVVVVVVSSGDGFTGGVEISPLFRKTADRRTEKAGHVTK